MRWRDWLSAITGAFELGMLTVVGVSFGTCYNVDSTQIWRQLMSTAIANSLIVETPRGPSIAGTRITVYSVMDLIRANWSKEHILQFMPLTTDQLDAVYEYIKENQEDVERSYERILHRSEELRSYYEAQNRARSPFPPEMPLEERRKLMLQKAAAMKASQAKNENHDPARS